MQYAVGVEHDADVDDAPITREEGQIARAEVAALDHIRDAGVLLVGVAQDSDARVAVTELRQPAAIESARRAAAPAIRHAQQAPAKRQHLV